MKSLPFILVAFAALMLAGCNGTTVFAAGSAAGMWLTKPKTPPSADLAHQIPQHESWCYDTMGDPECFPTIQNTQPTRLINVEPQNRYPLTARDYWNVVYNEK
jgi:hypothetical protein